MADRHGWEYRHSSLLGDLIWETVTDRVTYQFETDGEPIGLDRIVRGFTTDTS